MYLGYRGRLHALNEAGVSIQRQPTFNDGGERSGYREAWNINGFLQGNTQADVDALCLILKQTYAVDGGDLGLYFDNLQLSNHFLLSRACIGGTRVTAGPSFPNYEGAEFSTYRTYTVTVEGEVFDPLVTLLAWHESISFSGGGPRTGFLECLVGPPQKQLLIRQTTYRATQSGNAIGRTSYPIPPGPLWPGDLKEAPKVTPESPRRSGPRGRPYFTEFGISWTYEFESVAPFTGVPHPWPLAQ